MPRDAPVFNLDERIFDHNVCSAKRGAVGAPSAMMTDHLRPLLERGRVVGERTDSREHCQHHQAREDDGTQEGWWRRLCRGGDSESDCQDDCATVGASGGGQHCSTRCSDVDGVEPRGDSHVN